MSVPKAPEAMAETAGQTRSAERPPAFDSLLLADLEKLVGTPATTSFLMRLALQIDSTFAVPPQTAAQLDALRYAAHALASTAGMLGFRRLSAACVLLETACASRTPGVGHAMPALGEALSAKADARAILGDLIERRAAAS